jgi:predicted DNA-binding protein (MmcQ/YjbR family)
VTPADRIRVAALALPEAYEDAPWGHPVFKVADNRMFATMSDADGGVNVTVKMTDEERPLALELPFVRVASYVGRYGWVTAHVTDEESLGYALGWIEESWWLRAPARLRKLVELQLLRARLPLHPDTVARDMTRGLSPGHVPGRRSAVDEP